MNNLTQSIKPIIWAINPLDEKDKVSKSKNSVLKSLSQKLHAPVQPVNVVSDGLTGLSAPTDILRRTLKPLLKKVLYQASSDQDFYQLLPSEVIFETPSSLGAITESISQYAAKKNAELIYVSSHGRSGFKRAILGSFAETLLLHAKVPVIISGPNVKKSKDFKKVLFPTDFGLSSNKTFRKVIEFAKKLGAEVGIFHCNATNLNPLLHTQASLAGFGWVSVEQDVSENEEANKKRVNLWLAKAEIEGVKAYVEEEVMAEDVAQSIVERAQKKDYDLIAMVSQSSHVASVLLGSVTRNVARHSPCAVWFVRQQA